VPRSGRGYRGGGEGGKKTRTAMAKTGRWEGGSGFATGRRFLKKKHGGKLQEGGIQRTIFRGERKGKRLYKQGRVASDSPVNPG